MQRSDDEFGPATRPFPDFSGDSDARLPDSGALLSKRYLIEKEIGRGGIGVVYLARDLRLHSVPVVIKILLEKLGDDEERNWLERKFKEEIKALAQIDHPGVVRGLDVGDLPDGRSYLVMQYVPGTNLRSLIQPHGMDLRRVATLVRQIGRALSAAHDRGVLHRDLKPENVMLQEVGGEEYVKLIDFGIATVRDRPNPTRVETTAVAGTVDYMSPEQMLGKPSASSDIYALGVLAYELVTGKRPFNPSTPFELLELQRAGVAVEPRQLRPELSDKAQEVILKALSFASNERHASAKGLGDSLAQALTETDSIDARQARQEYQQAFILVIRIEGYRKLTVEKSIKQLARLRSVVDGASTFQQETAACRAVCSPIEDGLAILFLEGEDPSTPIRCGLQILEVIKATRDVKVRVALNAGPVTIVGDLAGKHEVFGEALDTANSATDWGDRRHLIVTNSIADTLSGFNEEPGTLQDLGERTTGDGNTLRIFRLGTVNADRRSLVRSIRSVRPFTRNLAMLALLLLLVAATVVLVLRESSNGTVAPKSDLGVGRSLTYSITAREKSGEPRAASGNEIFQADDEVRLSVRSSQSGSLYIIDERPNQSEGLPKLNLLFPSILTVNSSSSVVAGDLIQIPTRAEDGQPSWFIFRYDEGVEKVWLIFAESSVREIEAVRTNADPAYRGEIIDLEQRRSILRYLTNHSAAIARAEPDNLTGQILLKSEGDVLIGLLELRHRR
jgi:serine/threonine protein kinase